MSVASFWPMFAGAVCKPTRPICFAAQRLSSTWRAMRRSRSSTTSAMIQPRRVAETDARRGRQTGVCASPVTLWTKPGNTVRLERDRRLSFRHFREELGGRTHHQRRAAQRAGGVCRRWHGVPGAGAGQRPRRRCAFAAGLGALRAPWFRRSLWRTFVSASRLMTFGRSSMRIAWSN